MSIDNTKSTDPTNTAITFFGATWCIDCRRAKALLDRLAVPYSYIDLEQHPEAAEDAKRISGVMNIPVIAFADGTHQVEPSDRELEAKLRELHLI